MKGKEKNYQKGITLIALVITIIVLLILAGVTINIVLNSGLIEKSQNAVDKYSYESKNETEILDYLNKQFSLYITALDNINGTENKKLIESTTTGQYYNPVVPVGFKTVNTETASWDIVEDETLGQVVKGWNDGLVIEDSQGNQFVWVPVHNNDLILNGETIKAVPYGKWCTSGVAYNNVNIKDDDLPNFPSEVTENTQINTYGGFYIGRYEAGIPSEGNLENTKLRNVSGVPTSKKNQTPWNYIDYITSKANAESMYTDEFVKSGLLTGTQWDATMKWLENSGVNVQTDCTDWGNYADASVTEITSYSPDGDNGITWISANSITKPTSGSVNADYKWLLQTGNTDFTSRKNIYDLAGNLWEWTAEIHSSKYINRGGCFSNFSSFTSTAINTTRASSRTASDTNTYHHIGFRCVLYVM